MKTKKQKIVEINLGILVIVMAITVIAIMLLKYSVEGEKDMPYIIKQMVIISSANGENTQTDENKWNINIYQNSDIYLEIARNTEYRTNENLKSVKIEELQITGNNTHTPNIYLPAKEGEKVFEYTEENIAVDKIDYIIDSAKNTKERKLTTEGGILALSVCYPQIGTYKSNEEKITYDGTLLNKIGITNEDIKSTIKFNLVIETETNKKYKAEISLELPQEDITQTGISKTENYNLSNIIFKRTN